MEGCELLHTQCVSVACPELNHDGCNTLLTTIILVTQNHTLLIFGVVRGWKYCRNLLRNLLRSGYKLVIVYFTLLKSTILSLETYLRILPRFK